MVETTTDPHPRYVLLDQASDLDGRCAGRAFTILDSWYCFEEVWRAQSGRYNRPSRLRPRALRILRRLNAEHDAWLAA
jgi:hypothetical protein